MYSEFGHLPETIRTLQEADPLLELGPKNVLIPLTQTPTKQKAAAPREHFGTLGHLRILVHNPSQITNSICESSSS